MGWGWTRSRLAATPVDVGGEGGRQAAKLAQVSTLNNREGNDANSCRDSRRGWVEGKHQFGSEYVVFEVVQGIQVGRLSRHLEIQVLALHKVAAGGNRLEHCFLRGLI